MITENVDLFQCVLNQQNLRDFQNLQKLSLIINKQSNDALKDDQLDINQYLDKLMKSVYMEQLCTGQLFVYLKRLNLKHFCDIIQNLSQTKQRYLKYCLKLLDAKAKNSQYYLGVQNGETNENFLENQYIKNANKQIRDKKLSAQKSIYKIREYEQTKKLKEGKRKFELYIQKQLNDKVEILYSKLNDSNFQEVDFDISPEILIKLNEKINKDILDCHKTSQEDIIDLLKKIDQIKNKNSNYPDIFDSMRKQIKRIDNIYIPLLKFQREIENTQNNVKQIELEKVFQDKFKKILEEMIDKLRKIIQKQQSIYNQETQTQLNSQQIDEENNLKDQKIIELQVQNKQIEEMFMQFQCKFEINEKQYQNLKQQYNIVKDKFNIVQQNEKKLKRENTTNLNNQKQIEKQFIYYQKDSQDIRQNLNNFFKGLNSFLQLNETEQEQKLKNNLNLNDFNLMNSIHIANTLQQVQSVIIDKIEQKSQKQISQNNIQNPVYSVQIQQQTTQKNTQNTLQVIENDGNSFCSEDLNNTQSKNNSRKKLKSRKFSQQIKKKQNIDKLAQDFYSKNLQQNKKTNDFKQKKKSIIKINQKRNSKQKDFFKLMEVEQATNTNIDEPFITYQFVLFQNLKNNQPYDSLKLIQFRMVKTVFNKCLQRKRLKYLDEYQNSIQLRESDSYKFIDDIQHTSLKKLNRKKQQVSRLLTKKSSKKRSNIQSLNQNHRKYKSLNTNVFSKNILERNYSIRQSFNFIEKIGNDYQRLDQIHEAYKVLNDITRTTLQHINIEGQRINSKNIEEQRQSIAEAQRKTIKILSENIESVAKTFDQSFQQKLCNKVKVFIQNLQLFPQTNQKTNSKLDSIKLQSKKNQINQKTFYSTLAREKTKPVKKSLLNFLQIKQVNKSHKKLSFHTLNQYQKSDRNKSGLNFNRLLPEVVKIKQFIYSANVQCKNFRPGSSYQCNNTQQLKQQLLDILYKRLNLQMKNFNKDMIQSDHDTLIDEFISTHLINCEDCPHKNSFIIQMCSIIQRQSLRQALNLNIRDIQTIHKKSGIFI